MFIRYFNSRYLLLLAGILISHSIYAQPSTIIYDTHVADLDNNVFAVTVPRGYTLDLLTTDMQRPRMFIFDQRGSMLAGSKSGHIYRLKPPYTEPEFILILSDYPHSLALKNGYLYIAQTSGLYRIPYKPTDSQLEEGDVELVAKIPGGWGHNSRTIKIGSDGRLYVSLGIAGNCSDQYLDSSYPLSGQRGGVMVLDETVNPPQWRTWASGLRNPVGFDWHPETKAMYASNNGPDHLGYEQPPESFAYLKEGSFHGMPWFQFDGKQIHRDNCINSKPPRIDVTQPVAIFPARNAPMDVHFIVSGHLDEAFQPT